MTKTMRDREFVNRFCAFQVLGADQYQRGDMDDFLARCLIRMNEMNDTELSELSATVPSRPRQQFSALRT